MKKPVIVISFIFYLTAAFLDANGQILSETFESHNVSNCAVTDPFFSGAAGLEGSFKSSHGTAQIYGVINNNDCKFQSISAIGDDVYAFCDGPLTTPSNPNPEGIFADINISNGDVIHISLWYRGDITIELAKGLVKSKNQGSRQTPTGSEIISNQTGTIPTDSWSQIVLYDVDVTSGYNQLWIYSNGEGALLDDIYVWREECCSPSSSRTFQNIVDPPNAYVGDKITAGFNVISGERKGDVVVLANSDSVVFRAGNKVELMPGFKTELGANFSAYIGSCKKSTRLVVELDSLIVGDNPTCSLKYKANVCYGSGEYSYSWSNANMDENDPSQTDYLSFEDNAMISVTVTDLNTNEGDIRTLFIPKRPFHGPLSYEIPRHYVYTPDVHTDYRPDTFEVIDPNRLGDSTFGYNAYEVEFSYKAHGISGLIKDVSSIDKVDGFPFDYTKLKYYDWCNDNTGTYYFAVKFVNCHYTEKPFTHGIYNSVLFNDSCLSGLYPNDETSTRFQTNNEVVISPNPFSSILQIDNIDEPAVLIIETLNGQVVHTQKLFEESNSINLSFLVSGVYSISILDESGQVVKREKVVKI
jgi:hypothetical protein